MIDNASAPEITSQPGQDMAPGEFRRHGNALIEWVANYLENPRRYPVLACCQPGDLRRQLPVTVPVTGETMETILSDFEQLILPAVTHWNHPHFHGYFSISSSGPGIPGELLAAGLDVNAMLWKSCPAATELEQTTTSWVLDWLGPPRIWFGMILDSASNAVLQAVVAARQRTEPASRTDGSSGKLIAYISEQTHCSAEKALIAAGIGHPRPRSSPRLSP